MNEESLKLTQTGEQPEVTLAKSCGVGVGYTETLIVVDAMQPLASVTVAV